MNGTESFQTWFYKMYEMPNIKIKKETIISEKSHIKLNKGVSGNVK